MLAIFGFGCLGVLIGCHAVSPEDQLPLRFGPSAPLSPSFYEEEDRSAAFQQVKPPLPSLLRTEEPQSGRTAEATWMGMPQMMRSMEALEVQAGGQTIPEEPKRGWKEGELIAEDVREHAGAGGASLAQYSEMVLPAQAPAMRPAGPGPSVQSQGPAATQKALCTIPMWKKASYVCLEHTNAAESWTDSAGVMRKKLHHGFRCNVRCDSGMQDPDITTMICEDGKWMVDAGTPVMGIACKDSGGAWVFIVFIMMVIVAVGIGLFVYKKQVIDKKRAAKGEEGAEGYDNADGHYDEGYGGEGHYDEHAGGQNDHAPQASTNTL